MAWKVSKRRRARPAPRERPKQTRSMAWLCAPDTYDSLCCQGYVSLAANPEICAGVDTIARLVGSMTIHLMENREDGDVRILNELSRKIDIEPNAYMTRADFVHWIVRTMYLEGNGNAVVWPRTRAGIIQDLQPIPSAFVAFIPDGWGYRVIVNGKEYDPDDVLHFTLNPDPLYPWLGTGYRISLADVAQNLKQAATTQKGFMESKWKPSLIVKVDALTEEFSSPEGRRVLLESYIDTARAGEPWMIPAEAFDVKEIKPLTLNDLALNDAVTLDKRTVAGIFGVPPFVVGVGSYNRDEWNNFVDSKLMPLARRIEQELTRKLLLSPDLYFRFNSRALHAYDMKDLSAVGQELYVRGIATGNEVRDWLGMPPLAGLDDLVILENYIPRGMIADQAKLNGGDP